MDKLTVIHVDMFGGPKGRTGFRTGFWTATLQDGRQFRFFCSLPHQDGLNEKRMIANAQSVLNNGTHKTLIVTK
jgi:azurin